MTPRYAWLNGSVVPWDACVLHARTQGAFWGANVFEGVRAYRSPDGDELYLFRLDDHLARLYRSMKCVHMPSAYQPDDLAAACIDLVRANGFRTDVHVIVVAYFGMCRGFDPLGITDDTGVHITAVPWPRSPGWESGAAASVSSWRRIGNDSMPPRIKTGANYHNSRLAQHEAVRNGFDTTLILNQRGNVAEAPGACLMMVRDGQLVSPPPASGSLEGITLATVAELARRDQGLTVTYRDIDRTELYVADELFLCGTVAELLPITSVDRLPVGPGTPGPLTRRLQELYDRAVRATGNGWTTPAYSPPKEVVLHA